MQSRLNIKPLVLLLTSISICSLMFSQRITAQILSPKNLRIVGSIEACDELTDAPSQRACVLSGIVGGVPTLEWTWSPPLSSRTAVRGFRITAEASFPDGVMKLWSRIVVPASRRFTLIRTSDMPCGARIGITVAVVGDSKSDLATSNPLSYVNPDPSIYNSGADCDLGHAPLSVFTGFGWHTIHNGNTTTVFMDNPPLMGILDTSPGSFLALDSSARGIPKPFAWQGVDFKLDGADAFTFHDDLNDGSLGIAPILSMDTLPQRTTRWHTNGLQLSPGTPVHLQLLRRAQSGPPYRGFPTWAPVPNTNGTIALDPSTIIVGVDVIVLNEPGVPAPLTDKALAQLWFDGRAVDRRGSSVSTGGSISSQVSDQDPRRFFDPAHLADPRNGAVLGSFLQDIDRVWAFCGEYFHQNIQFRLVHFTTINSATSPVCARIAESGGDSRLPGCIGSWIRAANALNPPAAGTRRIPIVVVRDYHGSHNGAGEAFPEGIMIGEQSALENIGANFVENIMAHEIGHFLGFNESGAEASDFLDLRSGRNLMSNMAPVLTAHQCTEAYERAQVFSLGL